FRAESLHDHALDAEVRIAALRALREELAAVSLNLRDGDIDVALSEQVESSRAEVADQQCGIEESQLALQVEVVMLGVNRMEVIDEDLGIGNACCGHFADIDGQLGSADGCP